MYPEDCTYVRCVRSCVLCAYSALKMVFLGFFLGGGGGQNPHIFDALKSNMFSFDYVFVSYHHKRVLRGLCIRLVGLKLCFVYLVLSR